MGQTVSHDLQLEIPGLELWSLHHRNEERTMETKNEKWAIFWCSLLHPILFEEIQKGETYRYLKKLSGTEYRFPNGELKKPSLSTLKRKLKYYREGGFKSLYRKSRNDKGKSRAVSRDIIDKAVDIKKDQPYRSDRPINLFLEAEHSIKIARSTLYRHLKQHNATRLKLGVTKKKVRCRWTRDFSNDLWIGDFADGPYVMVEGGTQLTYLSLFIDCHSRNVVEGRYYLRQNLDVLIDSLLRAWMVHGVPNDLYLDNAKVYHANALVAACYALNINLIHRTKGDPAPGGLVERIFGTNQLQFETEVRAGDILTLNELNKAFSAWLNVAYRCGVHSETKQAPGDRYDGNKIHRPVDMDVAIKFFMKSDKRTVHKDFSDVSVGGKFYKVDPKYRGDRVMIRYDPFSLVEKVFIYSDKEEYLCSAPLYNRERGSHNDAITSPKKKKLKYDFISLINEKHEKQLKNQAQGIDYTKLSSRQWPFVAFVQACARLMGKKGGNAAFDERQLETLKRIYDRHPDLDDNILTRAFEKAEVKNISHVAHQLQQLEKEK